MSRRNLRVFSGLAALLCLMQWSFAACAQDLATPPTAAPAEETESPFGTGRGWAGLAGLLFNGSGSSAGSGAPQPWSIDGQTPYVQRFGIAHDAGKGIGVDVGQTTFEFMTPVRPDPVWDNLFLDLRFVLLNDATTAANLGGGYRYYNLDHNRIYGINVFYDYRQTDHNQFDQLGVGLESLGSLVDFRANFYVPDVGNLVGPVPGLFVEHLLITNRDEIAMTGGDFEAGLCLVDTDRVQTRVFGGGYAFDGHRNDDAIGWKARAEATLDQQFWIDAAIQKDDVFGTTASIGFAIRYLKRQLPPSNQALKPMDHIFFRRAGDAAARNIAQRLSAPVKRLQTIVLSQQPEIATDPGGTPLNFLHVVPGGAGTGTIEDPYGTLTAALADPDAGTSIIYTPSGGDFVENITLVSGATVLSNGPVQTVETQFGATRLPFSGSGTVFSDLPTLTGNVDLADNSRFSGFDVSGQVTGLGVSGFTIDNTRINSSAGDALAFVSANSATLQNLSLESTAGTALQIIDSSAEINDLTVTTAAGDGVAILNAGTDRDVSITNLSVDGVSGVGLSAATSGAGALTLTVDGTNSISSVGNALDARLLGGSTGDLILAVSGTTVASTASAGINLDGSAGAGTLFVSSLFNNVITRAGVGAIVADTVTFDADPTTAAIDLVDGGTLTIGSSGSLTAISGDGVNLQDPTGALSFTTLTIFNSGGTGLLVDTKGGGTTFSLSTGAGSTITTAGGPAMSLDPLDVDLVFDSIKSDDSATNGVFIDTTTGSIQITSTTINGSVMPSILIQNTPSPLSANFGTTVIDSTISNVFSDNVDITTGNGTNLSIDFDSLTITGP